MKNETNLVWQKKIKQCLNEYDEVSSPRGMEVREIISGKYTVPMPAYIDLFARKVNVSFMLAEAAWIISGSNRLEDISKYMKMYANFSDDGVFLRGAYGPKVVDQLGYVVDSIEKDNDTRQAVINIWRERPGVSKDIPCTISMQFLLRNEKLHMVTTMRSNDVVLGFTYDVFTFSMVAQSVKLLLNARGIPCRLGNLTVNAGSLHLYERHYDDVYEWEEAQERNMTIKEIVERVVNAPTYQDLINQLNKEAKHAKET